AKGDFCHNTISIGKDLYMFPMGRWGLNEIAANYLRGSYKLQFNECWSVSLSGTVVIHVSNAIVNDDHDTTHYYAINDHELDLHLAYRVWKHKSNSLHALIGPVFRDALYLKYSA